jgi:hypothetical protein
MTFFEIPTMLTVRLRLRAFRAGDIDASARDTRQPALTHSADRPL